AYTITPGQTEYLSIDFSGDQDWYKIAVDNTCSLLSTVTNNSGYVYYIIYDQDLNYLGYDHRTSRCVPDQLQEI
ncbi:MAG: hypothetical protein GX825_10540, partial [Syntrophomonadaceae bacterium]|nr:hypothetical protein [Syntrophomonadaceae bacterium]